MPTDANKPKRTTWSRPVDLADALAGEPPPAPEVCRWTSDRDGKSVTRALFYPNEVHSVGGEPEAMKSWLLLLASVQEIKLGHHVMYLDMEANDRSVVDRLVLLGAKKPTIKRLFHYYRPEERLTEDDQASLRRSVKRWEPTLVVLDGVTEAYSLHGLSIASAEDAATWFRDFSRQFQVRPTPDYNGPAIVELDHVVKSRDDRNGWTIGTQHKKAGIKGAMYIVESVRPFGKGKHGVSRLFLAKDSPGGVDWVRAGKRRYVGDLHCNAEGGGGVDAYIESPDPASVEDERDPEQDLPAAERSAFRQGMERVHTWVEANPGQSQRAIRRSVTGRAASIGEWLDQLVLEGYVSKKKVGQADTYAVVKDFNAVRLQVVKGRGRK